MPFACFKGILIDNNYQILINSNAYVKIYFDDNLFSNKNWDGRRCMNWIEIKEMINKMDGE